YPVAAQQPFRILSLALSKQLKVEIPDLFNRLHPIVRVLLAIHSSLKTRGTRLFAGGDRGLCDLLGHLEQTTPERSYQSIYSLNMSLGGSCGPAAKLLTAERTECSGVTRHV